MVRLLLLLSVLMVAGCQRETEEARIRHAIDAMAEALEAGDSGAFIAHVAENFQSQSGGMDKRQLRALLLGETLRNPNLSITLGPPEVKLYGNRATVKINVLALGGASFVPERGRTYEIESQWILEDGDWRCFAASWQ